MAVDPPQGRVQGHPPAPLSFRTETYRAGTIFPRKRQAWGELNYAISGVCEIEAEGRRFLSPPSYGVWIPPEVEHEAFNREAMSYVTVYVTRALCDNLPKSTCTLSLDPLLKAILADFAVRNVMVPASDEDARLAFVLLDRIIRAPRYDSYLPTSDDALIAPVISALQEQPGDRRALAAWALAAGVTERTLSRRWGEVLGMTFNEWRQRMRVVEALSLLDRGTKVQEVAQRLGYGDASAFIAMFRRATGESPTSRSRNP